MSTADLHLGEALPPIVAMACWGWLYRRRCRTLSSRGRSVPGWRQACFFAGAVLVVVAIVSPVDRLAEKLLYVHMIQHLLLGDIAKLAPEAWRNHGTRLIQEGLPLNRLGYSSLTDLERETRWLLTLHMLS
jgi:hypothetical protein